ncbi:Peptidyl-prolyl cis-trans isomerase FKBP20-1 [Sesamum angolense]|uniref:peptidylprolyl isomerase n=1 Tax=Sesamum angolense TaxID=2727404 RepID=A0AAE2BZB8_9LAMI|nr:Peptidyl-prolyl cis-trans isomerase FKBP20-1 [Sesamum angolense]
MNFVGDMNKRNEQTTLAVEEQSKRESGESLWPKPSTSSIPLVTIYPPSPQIPPPSPLLSLSLQSVEKLEIMSDSMDLTGDGGVLKTLIRRAKPDAIVPSEGLPLLDVHYEGILAETGEVFDTTHEDNTIFTFELGKGSVIKAWDIALKTMKVGEVAKITCKPEYAYGSAGSPPDIPQSMWYLNFTMQFNAYFEIELVACRPRKGSSLSSVSDERARLEELKKQRELAAAAKEEDKKKREEAKAAAAARIQAKLEAKKGQGKGKGKAK